MSALPKRERARLRNSLIGFVFQFHHLLPEFTVMENMLMPALIASGAPAREARERALETLSLLGLKGTEKKNANQLSGGQKQRVAIARALVNRPVIVLADEPTGSWRSVTAASSPMSPTSTCGRPQPEPAYSPNPSHNGVER